jgi:hypothetical protein
MLAHRPAHASQQQHDRQDLGQARHTLVVDERVKQREERFKRDHLPRQRQRQTLRRGVPQRVAEPRTADRQREADDPEHLPARGRNTRLHESRRQQQDDDPRKPAEHARHDAPQHGPFVAVEVRVRLQVARVDDCVPRPRQERAHRAREADELRHDAGGVAAGVAEDVDVDAHDAGHHHHERPEEAPQVDRAVIAPAGERHGHGQDPHDQRRRRDAHHLHGGGEQHVVEQVADERELDERDDIGARELAREPSRERQRDRHGDQPVHHVTAATQ